MFLYAIKDCGWLLLLWLGLGLWNWRQGRAAGSAIYGVAFFATFGIGVVLRSRSFIFTKLNSAREWHRWEKVLNLIDLMDRVGRLTKKGVNPSSQLMAYIARHRAMALIGLEKKMKQSASHSDL